MAWAMMFDVALSTALWAVADTMGGRAMLTLVLELALDPERSLDSSVCAWICFGLDCPRDWMQGTSIRVCSQPLLLQAGAADVMQQRRAQQSSLCLHPQQPPSALPRISPNPRKDRADCNAVFRLPPVHCSATFPLPRGKTAILSRPSLRSFPFSLTHELDSWLTT